MAGKQDLKNATENDSFAVSCLCLEFRWEQKEAYKKVRESTVGTGLQDS